MRFLVDAQLPPTLARWLEERGYEARHVLEVGLASADDRTIWRAAGEAGCVLVTKDRGFEELATREPEGPQIVWLRVGNVTKQSLVEWLGSRWPRVEESLVARSRIVEVW